jgi:hypothetical protein
MVAQITANCCYCGAKAALVLRGKDSHELSCVSCGAPLHDLKRLPVEPRAKTPKKTPHRSLASHPHKPVKKMKPQKKPKKKKGFSFVKAAFDVIEDVFDEILD